MPPVVVTAAEQCLPSMGNHGQQATATAHTYEVGACSGERGRGGYQGRGGAGGQHGHGRENPECDSQNGGVSWGGGLPPEMHVCLLGCVCAWGTPPCLFKSCCICCQHVAPVQLSCPMNLAGMA